MAAVEEILTLLNKWDPWNRITKAPERLDTLEERVASLEQRLERAPGEACPRCGALEYRVKESRKKSGSMGRLGVRVHELECDECGFTDERTITPE